MRPSAAQKKHLANLCHGPPTDHVSREFARPTPLVDSLRNHVVDSAIAGVSTARFTEELLSSVAAEHPMQEAWSSEESYTNMGLLADALMRYMPGS